MIAFVQPFGLQGHGGGARILRSLLAGAPEPVLSICTVPGYPRAWFGEGELHVPKRPYFGRIEHTRFGPRFDRAELWFGDRFTERLRALFAERGVRAVHAIPQGMEFWHAYEAARALGLPYVLNVHDDLPYNLAGVPHLALAMERLGEAWRGADARFVISEPMGEEYDRRYGARPWQVVTDGLEAVAPAPAPRPPLSLRVYLMGSIHVAYEANFEALFRALERLQAADPARPVSLTTRGGFPFPIAPGGVPVEVRPWGTQADIEADLAEADLLYLPLPFAEKHAPLARFSLATKMVTYVGTGLPILYHGPADAAAARLLGAHDAAVLAPTLDPAGFAEAVDGGLGRRDDLVRNALALAADRFMLADQRARFWGGIRALLPGGSERGPAERAAADRRAAPVGA